MDWWFGGPIEILMNTTQLNKLIQEQAEKFSNSGAFDKYIHAISTPTGTSATHATVTPFDYTHGNSYNDEWIASTKLQSRSNQLPLLRKHIFEELLAVGDKILVKPRTLGSRIRDKYSDVQDTTGPAIEDALDSMQKLQTEKGFYSGFSWNRQFGACVSQNRPSESRSKSPVSEFSLRRSSPVREDNHSRKDPENLEREFEPHLLASFSNLCSERGEQPARFRIHRRTIVPVTPCDVHKIAPFLGHSETDIDTFRCIVCGKGFKQTFEY